MRFKPSHFESTSKNKLNVQFTVYVSASLSTRLLTMVQLWKHNHVSQRSMLHSFNKLLSEVYHDTSIDMVYNNKNDHIMSLI